MSNAVRGLLALAFLLAGIYVFHLNMKINDKDDEILQLTNDNNELIQEVAIKQLQVDILLAKYIPLKREIDKIIDYSEPKMIKPKKKKVSKDG